MDFIPEERDQLRKFFSYRKASIKDIEYEVLFQNISYLKFESLLKFLKKNIKDSDKFKFIGNSTSLDIFYINSNNLKQLPIRHSLNSASDISKFCKTNIISNLPHDITYKNSFKIEEKWSRLNIQNYDIKINLKNELEYNKSRKEFISSNSNLSHISVNANNAFKELGNLKKFNTERDLLKTFRLKNRFSFMYNTNTRIDLTIVKSSKKEINNRGFEEMIPVKEFIESNIINEEKSYEVEVEFYPNKQLDIEEEDFQSNLEDIVMIILQAMENYPIITSIREKNKVKELFKQTVLNNHTEIINKKMKTIQAVNFIREQQTLSEDDKDITEITRIESLLSKDKFYQSLISSANSTKPLENKYTKLLTDIRDRKGFYRRENIYFPGPKVTSLELKDIRSSNINSIVSKEFSVTDKADGAGMLMFIVGSNEAEEHDEVSLSGNIYLIDNNLRIYSTNMKTENSDLHNTILNGEYLRHDKEKNKIHMYKIYDMYVENGRDIKFLPLISIEDKDTRIKKAESIVSRLSNVQYTESNIYSMKLDISVKHFEVATVDSDIFEKSSIIWNDYLHGNSIYKYDGMIYTPVNEPVGYNEDNIDYDLNTHITWKLNMKWKPPSENTIDFLVDFDQENVSSYESHTITKDVIGMKYVTTDHGNEMKRYKSLKLYVGDNEKNSNKNSCDFQLNTSRKKNKSKARYIKTLFSPTTPFDNEANIAKLYLNSKNEIVCYDYDDLSGNWKATNNMIRDDTIVEFAYIKENEKHFRWIPIKNRHDKTYSYKLGIRKQKREFAILQKFLKLSEESSARLTDQEQQLLYSIKHVIWNVPDINTKGQHLFIVLKKYNTIIKEYYPSYQFISVYGINYGNNFNTANSVWRSIHNPVTEEIITTGNNIPDESEEKYYRRDVFQKRSKSLTISMQHFHNIIIKNYYLIKPICDFLKSKNKSISLLDLACGKGGDIPKWIENGINNVVGIDINKNNIYDKNDGACVRLENFRERYRTVPNTYFLVGDSSKDISSGQAFNDKILWQRLWNSDPHYNTNYSRTRFHIITMMFALHYMFKNETDLDTFVENIDKNLRNGGYFIGACLDGKAIFDMLIDKLQNEEIVGFKGTKIIWKIKKMYNNDTFPNNENSLNYPIDVYMTSINSIITEFLVNFEYFKKKLESKNIKLLNPSQLDEVSISRSTGLFREVYDELSSSSSYKSNRKNSIFQKIKKSLTEDEKKISFQSRYFIFKKVSPNIVIIKDLSNRILQEFNNLEGGMDILLELLYSNNVQEVTKVLDLESKQNIESNDELWKNISQELIEQIETNKVTAQEDSLEVKKESIISEQQKHLEKIYTTFIDLVSKYDTFFSKRGKSLHLPSIENYSIIRSQFEQHIKGNKNEEKIKATWIKMKAKMEKEAVQFESSSSKFNEAHDFTIKYNNFKEYIKTLTDVLNENK